MPKKKLPKPESVHAKDSLLKFETVGINPEKHGAFNEAMLQAARAAVNEYPDLLKTIKSNFAESYPPQALSAFCCYGSAAFISTAGKKTEGSPEILQHHCELLQAFLLTVPLNEWGSKPITPDVMQVLFDTMPKLSDTFFMQRILDGEKVSGNDEEKISQSLQERARMHTHTVRNWGYFDQVVQTSRELYAPLDKKFLISFGFSATDLIDTLLNIQDEAEGRMSTHFSLLRKVLGGQTATDIVKRYYELVQDLDGSADEVLACLPVDVTREQMSAMIMAHLDLRLVDTRLFTPDGVAGSTGKSKEVISAILGEISIEPGELKDFKPEFLFLNNPVWERPAISLDNEFLVPSPQAAFSHIHRIIEHLASKAKLEKDLQKHRAKFLERSLEGLFKKALPEADFYPAFKWSQDGKQFENDLVVVIDHVVVIAEAKSHHLTPSGLRGARKRLKRHVEDLVLNPSIQSHRLEKLITAARLGDKDAKELLFIKGIDADKADRVIRLSVTLYDFGVLNASEQDFKKIGWVPADHPLAPSILIADLRCVADILGNPILFLHYLSERSHVQKSFALLGDELDLLGLYMNSAFNIAPLAGEDDLFNISGMSSKIDEYFEVVSAGVKKPKPKMQLRPLFRDIANRLSAVKQPGYTLIGFHLLECADPSEQKAIERNLKKLRKYVQKNYQDPKHTCTLVIKPPEPRKATVMFYLFSKELCGDLRAIMTQLANEAIAEHSLKRCVVFARCTEDWGKAFETALLLAQD